MTLKVKKIQKIRPLRNQGMTIQEIAFKLKISQVTVCKYLKLNPSINMPDRISSTPSKKKMISPLVRRASYDSVYYPPQNQDQYISSEGLVYKQLRRQQERRDEDEKKNREYKERIDKIRRDSEQSLIDKKQQEEQVLLRRLERIDEQRVREINKLKEFLKKLEFDGEKSKQTLVPREASQPFASSPFSPQEKQNNTMMIPKEIVVEEKKIGKPPENKSDADSKPRLINHITQPQDMSNDTPLDIDPILQGLMGALAEIYKNKIPRNVKEALRTGVYPSSPTGGYSKNEDVQNKNQALTMIPIFELAKDKPCKEDDDQKKDQNRNSKKRMNT